MWSRGVKEEGVELNGLKEEDVELGVKEEDIELRAVKEEDVELMG